MLELKAAFPSSYQTGNLSPGYLDVTYFPFKNKALSKKKLHFGLVLRHENLGLELWLMGQTLALQKSYWENWKESKWAQGRTDMPQYAIFEIPLLEIHDLDQKETLTQTILSKIQTLATEVETDLDL